MVCTLRWLTDAGSATCSLGITGGNGFKEEGESDVLEASVVDELDDDVNKPAGEEGAAENGHENCKGIHSCSGPSHDDLVKLSSPPSSPHSTYGTVSVVVGRTVPHLPPP